MKDKNNSKKENNGIEFYEIKEKLINKFKKDEDKIRYLEKLEHVANKWDNEKTKKYFYATLGGLYEKNGDKEKAEEAYKKGGLTVLCETHCKIPGIKKRKPAVKGDVKDRYETDKKNAGDDLKDGYLQNIQIILENMDSKQNRMDYIINNNILANLTRNETNKIFNYMKKLGDNPNIDKRDKEEYGNKEEYDPSNNSEIEHPIKENKKDKINEKKIKETDLEVDGGPYTLRNGGDYLNAAKLFYKLGENKEAVYTLKELIKGYKRKGFYDKKDEFEFIEAKRLLEQYQKAD